MSINNITLVNSELNFSQPSGKIGARKDGQYHIVSTGPDVCKTPMGSSMVPVPYSSIAFFDKAVRTPSGVRLNGKVGFNTNSRISVSQGTEPGTGKGIKDAGHLGPAKIVEASGSVNSGGYPTVRHGDKASINMSSLD